MIGRALTDLRGERVDVRARDKFSTHIRHFRTLCSTDAPALRRLVAITFGLVSAWTRINFLRLRYYLVYNQIINNIASQILYCVSLLLDDVPIL